MKKQFLFLLLLGLLCSIGNVWGAASTSTDGKYASGTIDFSTIGTLSATTTYWHNGVKFYSGNSANVSASTSAWSEAVSIPTYISSKKFGKNSAATNKWGSNGAGAQYTSSGFACSQHTIGIHVNSACTLTVIVNKNLQNDTDDAGITASIDATAYGTAWTSSTYKVAGTTALTVTSARADKTNYPGRYTLTIIVTAGDLTDGEAVVKMFNSSSGTGAGKLFCWESITITTPSCSTPDVPTGFESTSVSSTSATFEITDSEDASSYDIYCSTSSTVPTAETEATINVNTKTPTINALTANTTYYAWIRSVCDASHKSAWVALSTPGYFTTPTPQCATPIIAVEEEFNFENHGYKVTITNNETSSTLKVSTDGSSYTIQTSPYVTYATSTTHYYAKAVDKTGYDDSDVADKNVTNTFDPAKPYVAWVYDVTNYSGYKTSEDAIYTALASEYNMVPMGYSATTTLWNEGVNDIKNADLLVSTEAVKGGVALGNDLKNFIGALPMVNMKMFHYTTSGRWGWGTPANSKNATITPSNTLYKVLNGTAVSNGKVTLFSGGTNKVQSVEWGSAPANNVNMATDADGSKIAMHAIIDNDHLDKQFFGIGLSCDDKAYYTADAITVVKNAIAIMLAGTERLDSGVSSVSGTISSTGWSTFSSTYPLDLSSISGGTAYVATSAAADLVTLSPTSAKVASGEGVMIKGTANAAFTISTTSAAANLAVTNLLVGCPVVTVLSTNAKHYVMVSNAGVAEFQSLEDNGATIPAGKAYLDLTDVIGAPDRMRIVEAENGATDVNNIEANEKAVKFMENGQIYILRDGVVFDALGRVIRK